MASRHARLFHWIIIGALFMLTAIQPVRAEGQPLAGSTQEDASGTKFVQTNADGTTTTTVTATAPALASPQETCSLPAPALTEPVNNVLVNTLIPIFRWVGTGTGAYHIQVSATADFIQPYLDTHWSGLSGAAPAVQFEVNLAANTKYYWRVASVCEAAWTDGVYSPAATFRTGNMTGPFINPPEMLAPADGAKLGSPEVTFKWGNVSGATGWQLRGYNSLSDAQQDNASRVSWSSSWWNWTMDDYTMGRTYYWRIKARNAVAWGPLSPIRSFTIIKNFGTIALKDLGMPYSTDRGCSSQYNGCGGPYMGFYRGVCTDLVLDTYNDNGSFNIQAALSDDDQAHRGRYRYGTARSAEDMRRYFVNNQTFLANGQAYKPGDVGFFDWDGDGITDHVLVIETVDAAGRPVKMVDASGSYAGNPSGRAFEHAWNSYYEQKVQGHGRVNGIPGALAEDAEPAAAPEAAPEADAPLQLLQVTVQANQPVTWRLFDAEGRSVSDTYDENMVASNNEAFIPYIPGGKYMDTGTGGMVQLTWPATGTGQYFAELRGLAHTTYNLYITIMQDSNEIDNHMLTGSIAQGETQVVAITVSAPGGALQMTTGSPVASPLPELPAGLEIVGLAGTNAQGTLAVNEAGGKLGLNGVTVQAADLRDQMGNILPAAKISMTPANFSVGAGGSQAVTITVDMGSVPPGVYSGSLVLKSQNANQRAVPVIVTVRPYNVFLPMIIR